MRKPDAHGPDRAPGAVPPTIERRPAHVAVIAREFPPVNSSAALRALSVVEGLDRRGWRTTVITAPTRRSAWTDGELAERVPAACAVRRAFGFDTKAVLSLWGRYPRLLAFPDRDASWLLPALGQALRAHRRAPIDVVFSTSPPTTGHCVAALLRRVTGAAWVADLRDAWNQGAPPGRLAARADHRLERSVYAAADRIVVTTRRLADELGARHGSRVAAKIRIVANGFDETDFATCPPADARFTIVHAGSCTPPYRDPRGFLRALRACLDRGDLPAATRVVFLGAGADLASRVMGARLDGHVQFQARIPHRQAIASMRRASVLLLLQDWPPHRTSIPQKAYEYLRSGRVILTIAPDDSATAALMRGRAAVFLAAPEDGDAMAAQLVAAYRAWSADPGASVDRHVAEYDRRRLADEIVGVIDEARQEVCPARRGEAR